MGWFDLRGFLEDDVRSNFQGSMTSSQPAESYSQLLDKLPSDSCLRKIFPAAPTEEEAQRFTPALQEAVELLEAWELFQAIADLFEAAAARLTSATEPGHQVEPRRAHIGMGLTKISRTPPVEGSIGRYASDQP